MGLVPIGLGVSILFDAMQSLCNPDFYCETPHKLN